MSLGSMRQELLGLPGCNFGLVTTKINEALAAVQDENVFSFQLQVSGWLTPGLLGGPNTTFLSPGTMTVSPFSSTVTGDAVASQTWQAAGQTLLNQQIRVPYYSLYSIIAVAVNGTVSYVTLQSGGSGQTPGTYSVPVTDSTGTGSGGMVSIIVGSDGVVSAIPTVLAAGSGYTTPVINFSEGGTPATFTVGQQVKLTLDRPWMEPSQVNSSYMIYQAYFAAPPGFRRWYYILDTTNNNYMDWWSYTQSSLAEEQDDAQRINFLQPTNVVPWGIDNRAGSATLGQMLYELWPHPIMQLPYTFGCQALWPALKSPGDTLPYPLTDELIKLRAYEMLYLWKESQKGNEMERGAGANWQFLAQAMREEYNDRLKRIRLVDRNLVDLYFTKMRRAPQSQQVWGTVTGQANVGGWDS